MGRILEGKAVMILANYQSAYCKGTVERKRGIPFLFVSLCLLWCWVQPKNLTGAKHMP